MDVVKEIGLICPFLGCIVDIEAEVRRNPARLDGRNISTDYSTVRELIREIAVGMGEGSCQSSEEDIQSPEVNLTLPKALFVDISQQIF